MIIHSYFTEGYFEWGKLFVKSLAKTNGYDLRLFLSTRNLDDERICELHELYPGINVINENLDYDKLAKKAKVKKETLLKYKNRVETKKVDKESKVWKLMIAAEDRVRELEQLLRMYECPILHVDIDTYVTKDITPILETVESNDFTTRWRFEKQIKRDGYVKYENRATLISVQGYNGSKNSQRFISRWLYHLCSVSPPDRPNGFGQTSCYRAYLDFKDVMSFGDVPKEFLSPQGFNEGILWGANKGEKKETLKVYQKHFREKL